jgi:predicted ATPase
MGPTRAQGALPAHPTSFVGRRHELAVIRALLNRPDVRLVTLTGPGGAGKTRLAVAACAQVRPHDGVVFVDLSAVRESRLVPSAVAEALGLRHTGPRQAVTEVAEHLAARQVLLALDNVEQVLDAAPALSGLLAAAPGLTILCTSRARLDLAEEHVFTVPPLPLAPPGTRPSDVGAFDAVALFVQRGTAARPDFAVTDANVDDVVELCTRLDGLPLALELAAARLSLLSPRGILDRLGRRLDLLRLPGTDVVERHRTLRAALEWSHHLLDARRQALFADLGVFVGGFTVDAAEQVAGEPDVVDGVESLLSTSLLQALDVVGDEPRFGMLETIREYALDQGERSGRHMGLRDRHARWCRALAQRAEPALRGPDQVHWLDRLGTEHDNLRAALTWAAEGGDVDVGLRTGSALWRFWQVRGHFEEGRARLERLLDTGLGSADARADAALTVARCAFVQGDLPALQRWAGVAIPVHRVAGDDHSVGFALMILGAATGTRGGIEAGIGLLREALAITRCAQDRWLEGSCLGYLGTVLGSAGAHAAAREALEDGLAAVRTLGDHRCVGWMLVALARIARATGDTTLARARVVEALVVQRQLGDVWGISNCLHEIAALDLDDGRGDDDAARDLLAESLALALSVHGRPTVAAGLIQLARLAAAEDPGRAARLLGGASALDRALNDPLAGSGSSGSWVATVRTALGDPAFDEAWARGRAMGLHGTVAYASTASPRVPGHRSPGRAAPSVTRPSVRRSTANDHRPPLQQPDVAPVPPPP